MTSKPDLAHASMKLSRYIQPLLQGKDPAVQGAALADLVALYFAGHRPDLREEAIAEWIGVMRQLIEPSVGEIRERGVLPPGWAKQ